MKKDKKKPLYSLPDNIKFIMKKAWHMDKGLLLATIARGPVIVLLPLLATYLSKFVVQLITEGSSPEELVITILILSGSSLLLRLMDNTVEAKIKWRSFGNRFKYFGLCNLKAMDMDYENFENPDGQTKMEKAYNTLYTNDGGTQQIFSQLVNVTSNMVGLIIYSTLIFSLNPWIVLILVVMTLSNYFVNKMNNEWNHRNKDHWVSIDRKRRYKQNPGTLRLP